jgi:V8-like Glu-specific endopeptidase
VRARTLALIVLTALCGVATARADDRPAPVARHVPAIPTVGPLFFSVLGLGPVLGLPHYCTASVLHSPGHDLAITAAHCIYGTGAGIEFAPGFADNEAPYGVWRIRRVYVDPRWVQDGAARHDVAVLQLAGRGGQNVEDRTGRAPGLGFAPEAGDTVTVDGYLSGSGGTPITCTSGAYLTRRYPSFDCGGFGDGVSGGPWLAGRRVVGVTGGLHQGGCTADTSYSAPFGRAVAALLARARAGGPGDVAPFPRSDGC